MPSYFLGLFVVIREADLSEPPEYRATRDEFQSADLWHRYCRNAGLSPWEEEGHDDFSVPAGKGPSADLARATYGHSNYGFAYTWEGARVSDHLSLRHFKRGYRAVALANCRGRVLDVHISVSWSTVGVTDDDAVLHCQRRLLEKIDEWSRARLIWPAWIWVLERGRRIGLHTHLLLSMTITRRAQLRDYLPKAIQEVVGRPVLHTPESKTVVMSAPPEIANEDRQWEKFRYLFKGLGPGEGRDAERLAALLPGQPLKPQGEVSVLRFGVSPEIGPFALRRWAKEIALPPMEIPDRGDARALYATDFFGWYLANRRAVDSTHPPTGRPKRP